MRFDNKGDKTNVPDKERQIEAFQLLFMLLPPANRSLLKLLLDLLYHTARNQHVNKMSAINLATMFAPHVIWPKNVTTTGLPFFLHCICNQITSDCNYYVFLLVILQVMASDLQGNIEKLNNGIAFLIRHSQKLFKVNFIASWFVADLFFSCTVLKFLLLFIMCSQFALKGSCMTSGVTIPT